MKTLLAITSLALCSCNLYNGLQFLGYRPNIRYTAEDHYRAAVMASGTKARTAERIDYVMANKPPRPTLKNIKAAIEWPDLEEAGRLPKL